MAVVQAALLGLTAVLLAAQLKPLKPEYAVYLVLAASIGVGFLGLARLGVLLDTLREIGNGIRIRHVYLAALFKMAGITYIAEMLNEILKPELHTTVLLETMAGKGSEVGRSFEELREILDRVELSDKMGVCMDTCHVWDAGYDIVNDLDGVLAEFDRVVGLERLKAVHLNDSMNVRGAGKDRHARIGEGEIGAEAIVRVINHPALRNLPFCLETPNELPGYAAEIRFLKDHRIE